MEHFLSKTHSLVSLPPVPAQTIRLADFVMKKTMDPSHDADGFPMAEPSSPVLSVTSPRPLDFALSPRSLRAIVTAEAAFDQLVNEHEVRGFRAEELGAGVLSLLHECH